MEHHWRLLLIQLRHRTSKNFFEILTFAWFRGDQVLSMEGRISSPITSILCSNQLPFFPFFSLFLSSLSVRGNTHIRTRMSACLWDIYGVTTVQARLVWLMKCEYTKGMALLVMAASNSSISLRITPWRQKHQQGSNEKTQLLAILPSTTSTPESWVPSKVAEKGIHQS